MQLFGEIFSGGEGSLARCTLFLGGGGYFEGVKTVGDFSPERIVLYFPRASVEIEGEGLSIGKYYDGDLRLLGKVKALRFLDRGNNA